MRRTFARSTMGKMKYSFDDSKVWNIKFEGVYNFEHKDSYIQPAVTWKRDSLEVELGFEVFAGPSASFFGEYAANDRGYLKVIYKF